MVLFAQCTTITVLLDAVNDRHPTYHFLQRHGSQSSKVQVSHPRMPAPGDIFSLGEETGRGVNAQYARVQSARRPFDASQDAPARILDGHDPIFNPYSASTLIQLPY